MVARCKSICWMEGSWYWTRSTRRQQGVTLFVPPTVPRDPAKIDTRYQAKPTDSPAQAAWRERMGSEPSKAIYRQRGSTIETVNADLKAHRGLGQFLVQGFVGPNDPFRAGWRDNRGLNSITSARSGDWTVSQKPPVSRKGKRCCGKTSRSLSRVVPLCSLCQSALAFHLGTLGVLAFTQSCRHMRRISTAAMHGASGSKRVQHPSLPLANDADPSRAYAMGIDRGPAMGLLSTLRPVGRPRQGAEPSRQRIGL